jgi:Nitrile hydratase beta subunit, C-terminal
LPKRTLYLVAFNQAEVWGSAQAPRDKVLVDIYDHWLEPVA